MLISDRSSDDTNPGSRRTNHDEGEDVDLVFEDEEKDREDAAKTVDGEEGERDAQDSAVLVYLVELWFVGR
jgi:hypothetical protein